MTLNLEVNTNQHDDIYECLIDMHNGLDTNDSLALSARMILLLSNHIGDLDVIREAARVARENLDNT